MYTVFLILYTTTNNKRIRKKEKRYLADDVSKIMICYVLFYKNFYKTFRAQHKTIQE